MSLQDQTKPVQNQSDGIGQTHQKQALDAFKRQITNALSNPTKRKSGQ